MKGALAATALMLAVLVGCARHPTPDLMTAQPDCDTIPPRSERLRFAPARIPHVDAKSGLGAVVGSVTEFGQSARLPYGDAILMRSSGDAIVAGPVRVDSLGGFALVDVSPGAYVLRVRSFLHQAEARQLVVKGGAVDTVVVALRYHVCHGY